MSGEHGNIDTWPNTMWTPESLANILAAWLCVIHLQGRWNKSSLVAPHGQMTILLCGCDMLAPIIREHTHNNTHWYTLQIYILQEYKPYTCLYFSVIGLLEVNLQDKPLRKWFPSIIEMFACILIGTLEHHLFWRRTFNGLLIKEDSFKYDFLKPGGR